MDLLLLRAKQKEEKEEKVKINKIYNILSNHFFIGVLIQSALMA